MCNGVALKCKQKHEENQLFFQLIIQAQRRDTQECNIAKKSPEVMVNFGEPVEENYTNSRLHAAC